ncbi:hypothetical protein [Xenorhabdus miraniensis]|uniref:Propanediol utilization protein n=1 Tax=Xenorhabdus miraniensis TaxID=351674 RepID=A0A2D0JSK9_9GAMM|nr:hypothetical protein [Xenorhabdus miraniensis]PHM49284.1 propanediol utilization protein [Xenorhabdus miraniensis]
MCPTISASKSARIYRNLALPYRLRAVSFTIGELATHITGGDKEACHAAIKQSFNDWLADFGIGNREKYQVVTRTRDFIQKYGLSRFQPYTYGRPNCDIDKAHVMRINDLAGYLVHNRLMMDRWNTSLFPVYLKENVNFI